MSDNDIKHGGCEACKSKNQEILTSIMVPGRSFGSALCDKCIKKMEASNGNKTK